MDTITSKDKIINKDETNANEVSTCSPRRSLSYTHSFNENSSNWRRPWSCQQRVRDKLVSLLNSFGQRVGLPKSPSVIFSQNSDIIDRQSSLASSTEEVSANNEISSESKIEDSNNPDQFGLFKEFDFLEYELGSQEEESIDNFNYNFNVGVRRPIDQQDDQIDQIGLSSPCPSSFVTQTLRNKDVELRSDLSSDEEVGSVSKLFNSINYTNELVQEIVMNNNQTGNQLIDDRLISSSPSSVSSLSSTTSSTILKEL